MKKSNVAFLKELSFEEKRTLTLSFLEFTLKNYQFELDNDPTGLTPDQMEPIFSELRDQVFKVEAMTDTSRNEKGLSDAIRDMLTVLKRGQREGACRRLNYSLKHSLPDALFAKVYEFVGIPTDDLVLDNALYPSPS